MAHSARAAKKRNYVTRTNTHLGSTADGRHGVIPIGDASSLANRMLQAEGYPLVLVDDWAYFGGSSRTWPGLRDIVCPAGPGWCG